MIDEPTTVLTDGVLAALCLWFAVRLARHRPASCWWMTLFVSTALSALAGATWHGWQRLLGPATADAVWQVTLVLLGVSACALELAGVRALVPEPWRTRLLWYAALKLLAYQVWMWSHDGFVWVAANTGLAAALALVLFGRCWSVGQRPGAGWIVLGLLTSLAAAALQAGGVSLHAHFNHNDLYHVVQMAGFGLLYRGAERLTRGATARHR